jgi:hypothetical protein
MQFFKSQGNVDESFPDFVFGKGGLVFLMLRNFLVQVSIVRIFHDDAENKIGYYQRELL